MIIYFIFKMHCKCRIYTASLQLARGAPTTRPRRSRRPNSVATMCCLTRCENFKPRRLF